MELCQHAVIASKELQKVVAQRLCLDGLSMGELIHVEAAFSCFWRYKQDLHPAPSHHTLKRRNRTRPAHTHTRPHGT